MDRQGYCVKCKGKKDFKYGTGQVVRTKNNRVMLKGKCGTCGGAMNRFLSKSDMAEGSGLLSMLGIDSGPLKNIPLIGALLG